MSKRYKPHDPLPMIWGLVMPTIEGVVERITYQDEESTYSVARLQEEAANSLITIVGSMPGLNVGETLRISGDWVAHAEYGQQFQVETVERIAPATLNGMERYLGSGLIKGIGPVIAKKIVRAFGLASLEIIRARPEKLTEVDGIGPKKAERIAQAVAAQKDISEIMVFLQGYGITPGTAVKIYRIYGRNAIGAIRENPYQLAQDVYGIGFKTADRIATHLGVVTNSPHRIKAGLIFLLNEFCGDGHVYAVEDDFCRRAAAELEVSEGLVREAVSALMDARVFCGDRTPGGNIIYPSHFYHAESGVASKLLGLMRAPLLQFSADAPAILAGLTAAEGRTLASAQHDAILLALKNGVTVITGGPGTGKTTTIRSLLQLCLAQGWRFLLAAPTGRAAKRLSEATGHDSKTIHRLLEFNYSGGTPSFQRHEKAPLDTEIIIIDETSMLDLLLFYHLLKAIPPGTRLVLVGDVDQLPSVGSGNVLRDLIDSKVIPAIRLQTIFRQAEESLIIRNAHRINQGEMPVTPAGKNDFYFIACDDPEQIAAQIVDLAAARLPRYLTCDPIEDIQVLTPMRKTITGVDQLNQLLQERLNPLTPRSNELRYGTSVFRENDKVMQTRNDYQKMVFNGDMGRIRAIDREEGQLHVAFPEPGGERIVVYDRDELDELAISYAISVHKSQGSEYPVVIMPLSTQHYMMLQRNLLYTAISRAKRMAVIVGTKKAMAMAVKNNRVELRNTRLAERLRQG